MLSNSEVKNGVITSTRLGIPHTDHGILSFYINVDYGGAGQGFGGYVLDTWDEVAKQRVPTSLASSLLIGVGELFGKDWEDLPRTPCRVFGDFSKIKAIGHFLENKWLWLNEEVLMFVVTPLEAIP